MTFAGRLHQVFDVEVPVGLILSPATDIRALAGVVATSHSPAGRPSFASVHGATADTVRAADLQVTHFVRPVAAPDPPATDIRTVLLTGATGFLGRFLLLEWLERVRPAGGKVVCLVRAADPERAGQRLAASFDSDPTLAGRYRALTDRHLEVLVADKAEPDLGLDHDTWWRLAGTVDAIVDCGALVNHLLPYRDLFGPNVVGTGELIRLAVTDRLEPFHFMSTMGVADQVDPASFTEDTDVRSVSPQRRVDGSYANGYCNSKWASEVLLRAAHDRFGLPVTVFRCALIMAHTVYAGQINVPDMFARLLSSVLATGIAPGSFYELDREGQRRRTHFDGLPVDFVAAAISALAAESTGNFRTYHVMNPHDDGIGLDECVDWLIDAGYPIARIADYDEWLYRFRSAVRALPPRQRQHSVLPLLHGYQVPQQPVPSALVSAERFHAAVRAAKVVHYQDIPHITAELIVKSASDLAVHGLL